MNLILDENIYNSIINMIIHHDFIKNKKEEMSKTKKIESLLIDFFKNIMHENKIKFKKSSKYLIQSCFSKISFMDSYSIVSLYFELIGKKYKKTIDLIDVIFLRHNYLEI